MPHITDEAWDVISEIIHAGWYAVSNCSHPELQQALSKYQSGNFEVFSDCKGETKCQDEE